MTPVITFFSSTFIAFLAHHFGEKFFTKNGQRKVRLVLSGYQIHHSFFGLIAIILSITFAAGFLAIILFGYGIGNIWQHKHTHNRVGERGMVFVSKILNK